MNWRSKVSRYRPRNTLDIKGSGMGVGKVSVSSFLHFTILLSAEVSTLGSCCFVLSLLLLLLFCFIIVVVEFFVCLFACL